MVESRRISAEQLKALAHPLRYQLLEALMQRGPATASQLAEALGESSGATSYHLRQLAKHGFVEEEFGRGTARERWWRRVPGGITIEGYSFRRQDDTRDAATTLLREIQRSRQQRYQRWVDEGGDRFGHDWVVASLESETHLILTREELAELSRQLMAVVDAYSERSEQRRPAPPDDAAHIDVQLYAYPTEPDGDHER